MVEINYQESAFIIGRVFYMRRTGFIFMLLLQVTLSYSQERFGKYHIFVPVNDTVLENIQLGHMIARASGKITLKTGGTVPASIEFYSRSREHRSPDLYVIRRQSGRIESLGLDTTAVHFIRMRKMLGNNIEVFKEEEANLKLEI